MDRLEFARNLIQQWLDGKDASIDEADSKSDLRQAIAIIDAVRQAGVQGPRLTYQELAQQALDVQDACNLSGVAIDFGKAMDVLWAEARQHGHSTDWINRHPIVTLFIDKLWSLNGIQGHNDEMYSAYCKVREIANKTEEKTHPQ